MILTPTYHVFHMYRHHQGAELVESFIEGNKTIGVEEEYQVSEVMESVSVDADGVVNVTVNNLSASEAAPIEISFTELEPSSVESAILTGGIREHNTFEEPENVKEKAFTEFKTEGRKISLTVPACSIISLRIK